jgi:hypothetical protein
MSKPSLWRWRLNAYVYIRSWYGVKFVITLDHLCVKKETWREGRGLVRRKNKLSKKLWIISFQNAIRDSSFQKHLESKLLQVFFVNLNMIGGRLKMWAKGSLHRRNKSGENEYGFIKFFRLQKCTGEETMI